MPEIYKQLFEKSPLPKLTIERDDNGAFRVGVANFAAAEYFGAPLEDFSEKSLDAFLDVANKEHIFQSFKVCFSSAVPVTVQIIPVLPGNVRIQSFYLNPLLDEDGHVYAIDMTARPPAPNQEGMRRERDDAMSIFASVFDASDVGIVVTDHNRRIIRVNETFCKTYGWEPMDLLSHEFTILFPPNEHEIARKRHDDLLGEMFTEKSREIKILRKNGVLANVIASSGMIELSGKRKFRISTLVDITNLKKIERDLRRAKNDADAANRAKSAFLANMSHELRTPLNAIIGFSDLMVTGTMGEIEHPQYREYLSDIGFSAQHLLSIINDVLDMSKIEAGRMRLEEETISLAEVMGDTARLMSTKAKESDIEIIEDIEDDLPMIKGDERMIRQVLLNLISNAIKFSHPASAIKLSARQLKSGGLELCVIDEGIGIPEGKIGLVFEPFGQVSDPRTAKGQGTGLGLPLTRAMIELHGGTINISSAVDAGTNVSCTFPANRLILLSS